jgi:hypothetical protein
MNRFSFVDDKILRKNLNNTFNHILNLITVIEGTKSDLAKSSFRKTVIIYTASIIEALLLWRIKKEVRGSKIELSNFWKYHEIRVLHKISDSEEIIAGKRILEKKSIDKLDLVRTIDSCFKYKIIDKTLYRKLNSIRKMRNNLHIGNMEIIDKQYSDEDLEMVFSVAREVKELIFKNS